MDPGVSGAATSDRRSPSWPRRPRRARCSSDSWRSWSRSSAGSLFVVLTLTRSSITGAPGRPALDLATIGYLVIMSLLACSALAYLITRLGYYSRTRSHRRATRAELSQPFERSAPSLTVLIPSYQEDERVIRMTRALRRAAGVPRPRRRPAHRRSAGAQVRQARGDARSGQAAARRHRGAPRRADAAVRARAWPTGTSTSRPPAGRRVDDIADRRGPLRVRRDLDGDLRLRLRDRRPRRPLPRRAGPARPGRRPDDQRGGPARRRRRRRAS